MNGIFYMLGIKQGVDDKHDITYKTFIQKH